MIIKNSIIKILLLSCIIFTTKSFAEKRIALVIGNSSYTEQSLKNPIFDAIDISKILHDDLGFDVDLKLNVNHEKMEKAVQKFGKKLQGNTVGFFYYAGHGVQYEGLNYLIPIGAIPHVSAPEHLKYKTVNIGYILGVMKKAGNDLNIIVLDACRNNPFRSFSRSLDKGLKRISGAEGTIIAYSTSPGKIALDGDGRNSPYTEQLIESIKTPNLPIEIMFKQVRKGVKSKTSGKQSPWYEASIDGDFYFNMQKNIEPVLISPKLSIWLKLAKQRLYKSQLITPKDDSAFYYIKKVLERDPENQIALTLRDEIQNSYIKLMEKNHGNQKYVIKLLKLATLINPNNVKIKWLNNYHSGIKDNQMGHFSVNSSYSDESKNLGYSKTGDVLVISNELYNSIGEWPVYRTLDCFSETHYLVASENAPECNKYFILKKFSQRLPASGTVSAGLYVFLFKLGIELKSMEYETSTAAGKVIKYIFPSDLIKFNLILNDTDIERACPWVYIYDGNSFLRTVEIIQNLSFKKNEKIQKVDGGMVKAINGVIKVKISEEIYETSYIDYFAIELEGKIITPLIDAVSQNIQTMNEKYLVLERGETATFIFHIPKTLQNRKFKIKFIAKGYYIPYP